MKRKKHTKKTRTKKAEKIMLRKELNKKLQAQGYLTVRAAAKVAHVPLSTMYKWLERYEIRTKKIAGGRYVNAQSLKEFVQ